MTSPVREPRSLDAATELLEQFATLQGQIETIEQDRQAAIATINARADTAATALISERDAIRAKLEPWWAKNAEGLTKGERKSIELGGCIVGSRTGSVSLAIDGDEKALAQVLAKRKWAAGLFRATPALDKSAIRRALAGVHGKKLKVLGFSEKAGAETFVLERAEQAGTMTGDGA